MEERSRRRFLEIAGIGIAGALLPSGLLTATSTQDDLVIRGGEVIDPSQQLRAKKDVAVSRAAIVGLRSNLGAKAVDNDTRQVFDATRYKGRGGTSSGEDRRSEFRHPAWPQSAHGPSYRR